MRKHASILVSLPRLSWTIVVVVGLSACTPHFNRQGQPQSATGLANPILDLTAQGGSSVTGVSNHFRLSRVAIGGNTQRIRASSASGKTMQGGPGAPH